jgi:hypothetical protein
MAALQPPSPAPDLGAPPPLIPKVESRISGRTFAFFYKAGSGHFQDVTNDCTEFVPIVGPYLPLLTPKLTKAGKVAVRQPHIPKRNVKWWRAQCGFRGLPSSGALPVLQQRLREHGDVGMERTMLQAMVSMKDDYSKRNDQKLQEIWAVSDDSKKAVLWPKKFLYETFLATQGARKDPVVVRVDDWANAMEKAAQELHIAYETTRIPVDQYPGGEYTSGHRQVVLGTDPQAVRAKSAELHRELQRANQRTEEAKQEKRRKKGAEFEARFAEAEQQGKNTKGKWDVAGHWSINCPYMEEQWGQDRNQCTLEIGFTEQEDGLIQMWAEFDFIAITGIIRFVNTKAAKEPGSTKRSAAKEEEEEDDDFYEDNDLPGPTQAQFLFPATLLPSPKNQEFEFRWRGQETGEGEIQLYSDEKLCTLDFSSANALEGIFKSDLTDDIEFRGVKRDGGGPKRRLDIDYAWHERNEDAYERARVGRWH